MKNIFFFFVLSMIVSVSCSKKKYVEQGDTYVEPRYDTTAVDSFSTGAISVDVAAQIRRSSIEYQDSLKAAALAVEIAKKEAETKAKEESKAKEDEKKKKEEEKKAAKKESDKPKSTETPASPEAPKSN